MKETGISFSKKIAIINLTIKSLVVLIFCFSLFQQASGQKAKEGSGNSSEYISKVWVSDLGNGTYRNPVINADYSDPDAIRVGEDYYLTSSSFTCAPGLPVLHSRDLVNWKIIGHALERQIPEETYAKTQQGKGVWAPAIRYHNGQFYIYYPDPDYGIYMVKTTDPAGRWEDPVLVIKGKGLIDPCPLWDDDGSVYLVNAWAGSRAGINSILTVYRLNSDGTSAIDNGRIVYDGRETNPTIEGPKIFKRDGYYYISAPAGGVTRGWQLILRSTTVYGPFEEKIVIDQGSTPVNGPHQGAYVDTPTGESWFLHFQDKGAYGRVVHLQPVKWIDGWPVTGYDKDGDGKGEPVLTYRKPVTGPDLPVCSPGESDEFNGERLGLQWQWNANPSVTWMSLLPGKGMLRLYSIPLPEGYSNLWDLPNFLGQKLPAESFSITTKMRIGNGKAGLGILGRSYSSIYMEKSGDSILVKQVTCTDAEKKGREIINEAVILKNNEVYLRVSVSGPDANCSFSYSLNGKDFSKVGKEFKAVAGGWIGAKAGLFCLPGKKVTGYADFDWFRVE
ncbi:MAG: glycoside hydrolase 43 family protein [Bacteroidales bacterium]